MPWMEYRFDNRCVGKADDGTLTATPLARWYLREGLASASANAVQLDVWTGG